MNPEACTKMLLDVPWAYALRTLKGMDRTDSKVVVVTLAGLGGPFVTTC